MKTHKYTILKEPETMMNIQSITNQMLSRALLTSTLVVATAAPVVSHASDDARIENSIRNDKDYQARVDQARRNLQVRGYQVKTIKPDAYRGRKTLAVDAIKNGQEWEIRLAYPSLRIISEKLDD